MAQLLFTFSVNDFFNWPLYFVCGVSARKNHRRNSFAKRLRRKLHFQSLEKLRNGLNWFLSSSVIAGALVPNAIAHVTRFEAKLWELFSWELREPIRTLQVARFVNCEFVQFFHKLLFFRGSFHARVISKIAARWVCAVSCVRSKGISLIISRIVTAKWTFLSGSVDAHTFIRESLAIRHLPVNNKNVFWRHSLGNQRRGEEDNRCTLKRPRKLPFLLIAHARLSLP